MARYERFAKLDDDEKLKRIKADFDADYTHNQTTRIKAADDLLFSRVTQFDSSLLESSQLGYKGEFNILRKATREIMSDLRTNQVQIEFEPKADSRETDAELLNGLYLSCDRENTSIEAYDNASQECVDCGIGGWELLTEYESNRAGDRNQRIRRRPIYEFNNTAFPDCNAKLLDKSDGRRWTILEPFSEDGYKTLYEEMTGEETDCNPENFASPECSYVFPWVTGNELYYVARHYRKEKVKDKILTLTDPLGQPLKLRESDLLNRGEDQDVNLMDELIEQGFEIVSEKAIKRWEVTCYVCSGERILKEYVVAGEEIPVVPMYGERAFVEGEETYEGVVRLAKDPQRLRNFAMSYLGDILSRSPREKPLFYGESVAGYENMYNLNGAENNYPYALVNRLAADGTQLPQGPIGTLPAPQIPVAMTAVIDYTRQAVEDVANPGLPKDIMDADMSGHAIELLQARLDNQSQVYQDHRKHAQRYDAAVFASMASMVYDAPRKVTLTLPDGSRKVEEVMSQIMDDETGELVIMNDLTGLEFDVYATLGPSYSSKRDKTYEQLGEMAASIGPFDPEMAKLLMIQQLTLTDGVGLKDIRAYATKQLIAAGVKEPETEQEIEFAEQLANQEPKTDPNLLLAQGEMLKGQAAILQQQREAQNDAAKNEIDKANTKIKAFDSETKRIVALDNAQDKGLNRTLTKAKVAGQNIQNARGMLEPFRARVNG